MSFGLARGKQLDVTGVGRTFDDFPPFEDGPFDPREWFPEERRTFPLEIEIGSGKGTFLVQQAALTPDVNYVGIEYANEFFRYAADRLRRHELGAQVQMVGGDAVDFLRYRVVGDVCRVIHVYFPDPWPKTRHHKRRMIQDRMLVDFHRLLQRGGEVRIVTDHDDYWAWIEDHAGRNTSLFERHEFNSPDSAGAQEVVGTNFERKYRREGRPFHGMVLRRLDTSD